MFITTRVSRGASRVSTLAAIKLARLVQQVKTTVPVISSRTFFSAALVPLVMVSSPISVTHAAGVDLDEEPPSTIPSGGAGVILESTTIRIVTPTEVTASFIEVDSSTLQSITTGKSRATEAEEAAAAEAARIAAENAVKTAKATKLALQKKVQAQRAESVTSTASSAVGKNDYDDLFKKYFGDQWMVAKAIGMAESGLNPNAVSSTNDHGIMQINKGYLSYGEKIYDPEFNIYTAWRMWSARGWFPWTVFKKGTYLNYLR